MCFARPQKRCPSKQPLEERSQPSTCDFAVISHPPGSHWQSGFVLHVCDAQFARPIPPTDQTTFIRLFADTPGGHLSLPSRRSR